MFEDDVKHGSRILASIVEWSKIFTWWRQGIHGETEQAVTTMLYFYMSAKLIHPD